VQHLWGAADLRPGISLSFPADDDEHADRNDKTVRVETSAHRAVAHIRTERPPHDGKRVCEPGTRLRAEHHEGPRALTR
jgi:hypothetical protein